MRDKIINERSDNKMAMINFYCRGCRDYSETRNAKDGKDMIKQLRKEGLISTRKDRRGKEIYTCPKCGTILDVRVVRF
jgi:hypothetical protein